ncbi:MAG: endo-1,4-beta-xylanase [Candidatus Woesebacteria bacterium]|jgi:hypothetical protein
MKLGTTFSHRQLQYLNYPVIEALHTAFKLKLDYLRLGTYWDEIETTEHHYSWSSLEKILKLCQKNKQKVVLTVGLKAPRYPEFYFPTWLKNKNLNAAQTKSKILDFISKSVSQLSKFSCISHWQVENEPLDPSGPDKQTIPFSLLKKEVDLVRSLDKRPIITNLWGNALSKRNLLPKLEKISDVLAIDLYYQQFFKKILGKSFYIGPLDNQKKMSQLLVNCKKEVWVMELQAEPWEANQVDFLSDKPQSISPEKIKKFYQQASQLPVTTIMFWGFEYWFYQFKKGNAQYLDTIAKIMKAS